MSQPPGQQPPQGEFGAPYGPPPETFPPPGQGTAQPSGPYAAPAQPGPYGPPAPPAQPAPGYGYPPQPGPYGQPPQGYGYPGQQPPQPPQSGGPRGGGRFRGRTGTIVAAVLAVALLAGGGIWFALDGDGGSGKPTAGPELSSGPPDPSPSPSPSRRKNRNDDQLSPGAEAEAVNAKRKPGEAKMLWLGERRRSARGR